MVSYYGNIISWWRRRFVLILIVVEDGLVQCMAMLLYISMNSLNPSCSGSWSRTGKKVLIINEYMVSQSLL